MGLRNFFFFGGKSFLNWYQHNVILLMLGYLVIWVKIVVLILLVQNLKIEMFYIC